MLLASLSSDIDDGVECSLSMFADGTKLSGAFDTVAGKVVIQRDLNRLERCLPTPFPKHDQHGWDLKGLPVAVVRRAVRQANQKQCFVCGERGAAITCAESGCERSFHLPCAMDGECVTHFFGPRSSYCWEHRPSQESREAPAEGTNCLICLEPVGDSLSYHTMVCPACAHCWFHRGCIQQQALNAGAWCFRCPSCQDILMFLAEMFLMGIHIPLRRPLWEESDAYESLLERHSRCNACECLYRGGREQAEREGD
ncbi:G2/M phase-specific E3 ubiquitin-protein ligase-like isoform X1 [Gallus gallus]|uniref:G2/M phase-specific E3 ubiquitin-protein ligase-like isoform X1 n=1 Tax=Gallus gallus TaxID=9031 RepID=UPI001AEB36B5|nr:G2/M phase-specific E3 ubiquitin-protein ligase-like isoform X1 [Gallus gallus]